MPMLTITSYDMETVGETEGYMVLDKASGNLVVTKCKRFDIKKPVILFSCRVHPGETPCSHALNGCINK